MPMVSSEQFGDSRFKHSPENASKTIGFDTLLPPAYIAVEKPGFL